MSRLAHIFTRGDVAQLCLRWFGLLSVVCILAALLTEFYPLAAAPFAGLLAFLLVVDYRQVFFLLFLVIPFSTEVELPGGLGTDLPDEPLILLLFGVYTLYVVRHADSLDTRVVRHPLSLLLLAHVGWIGYTALTSADVVVSIKFLLAKIWYVVVFYFLAARILTGAAQVRRLLWYVLLATTLTVVWVLVRHFPSGFDFEVADQVVRPFYRNHVNYASMLALLMPPLVWQLTRYRAFAWRWWLLLGCGAILLTGIWFSYTRAAYVCLLGAGAAYFVIRWRWLRYALVAALLAACVGVIFLAQNNNYLAYAPNYERTVSIKQWDNLLEATAKGEDISTMERVYRWVAGSQMIPERPLVGFGPGNFYNFYRGYTVSSFETYVSHNPEKSGIHSYYLMTLVEQGWLGFLLFLALVLAALLYGERLYHRCADADTRALVMALVLSLVVMDALLLINDMVETDKVGPFFFMSMAVLVGVEVRTRHQLPRRSGAA